MRRLAVAAALVVAPGAVASGAAGPLPCPASIGAVDAGMQRAYAEFRRSVESSPLARYLGRPVSCEARADGGAIRLTLDSPAGSRLEVQRVPAIEATEQRLSEPRLTPAAAVPLLQRTERWAFGDRGCGIRWNTPPAEETGLPAGQRELVYAGTECSCQGRLVYRGAALSGVAFRSAC